MTGEDVEITLQTLNYATRQLASELELERLVYLSLETLADFSHSSRVVLLVVEPGTNKALVLGNFNHGKIDFPQKSVVVDDTPVQEILTHKRPTEETLRDSELMNLPYFSGWDLDQPCQILPLVGPHNQVLGLSVIEQLPDNPINNIDKQVLIVLGTLIAAALENVRLFRLATIDGLTGLYVRRFFEIRLREEMARIRRHGGSIGLMIIDIDHFKSFNDTYGHQQGDLVLSELAVIMRDTIRADIDIACRYGGEEFIAIMPQTDRHGAIKVAERFRTNCESYPFPGQKKPLKVTVSVGVAVIDHTEEIDRDEFLRRADSMLYEAKKTGRNKVLMWQSSTGK